MARAVPSGWGGGDRGDSQISFNGLFLCVVVVVFFLLFFCFVLVCCLFVAENSHKYVYKKSTRILIRVRSWCQ